MEASDRDLLTTEYWEDPAPDVRMNPQVPLDLEGLADVLRQEDCLQGHVIFSTSGSSGVPKLVCLSRHALMTSARMVNRHLAVTAQDRWLCALPTFHVGGFGILARAHVAGAVAISLDGRWGARRFAERCAEEQISLTSLVPAQIHDLVTGRLRSPGSLRAVIVGGGKLAPAVANEARDLGWPLLLSYGMTETASQIATQRPDEAPSGDLPVLDGWEVRANPEGLLEVRGEALFSGYLTRGNNRWSFLTRQRNAWFPTGDLGQCCNGPAGLQRLRVEGRAGRTIKILGELVDLDRLEELLLQAFPAEAPLMALECLPDERSGGKLILVMESAPSGMDARQIVSEFNLRVAPFERIQKVIPVQRIPRSALGKVERGALAEIIARDCSG